MGSAQVCSAWSDPASRHRSRRAVDYAQPQCDERLSICRRRSRHRSSRCAEIAPEVLRRRQSARVVQFASFNLLDGYQSYGGMKRTVLAAYELWTIAATVAAAILSRWSLVQGGPIDR